MYRIYYDWKNKSLSYPKKIKKVSQANYFHFTQKSFSLVPQFQIIKYLKGYSMYRRYIYKYIYIALHSGINDSQ